MKQYVKDNPKVKVNVKVYRSPPIASESAFDIESPAAPGGT